MESCSSLGRRLASSGPRSLLISFFSAGLTPKPVAGSGDLHLRLLFEMSLNLNRPSISPSCLKVTSRLEEARQHHVGEAGPEPHRDDGNEMR